MRLPVFLLDRWLSAYEHAVPEMRYNLASSAGPDWTLNDLMSLAGEPLAALGDIRLSYAPAQGSKELRTLVARLYDVDPDWVALTTGASEALVAEYCLASEPGASIVLPAPMYPAMVPMAQAWGLKVATYRLERASGFAYSADRVLAAVDETTRLVVVITPHNPTGSVIAFGELARLAAQLAERRIPLLVDEVYHPLYFGTRPPSAAKLPNAVVVSDLSKAFSLPGLRIGWVIEPDAERRERLVDLRSYISVSGSPLTEAVAAYALRNVEPILGRLNGVARANLSALEQFMGMHRADLGWISPTGGTVAFPWLLDERDTRPLCRALAKEGVLFAPGDCFDAPAHFRIGFGRLAHGIDDALQIASQVLRRAPSSDS